MYCGIFYGMLGLFLLRKILRLYRISDNIISLVLVTIFFCNTHLFYYSV